ncbi:hypothetical protein ASG38_02100 [Flavobacterium sp. Leaf359]|nr:hypothetical protein ASG38_02100 [Flavobacterium sp. Leaf359]
MNFHKKIKLTKQLAIAINSTYMLQYGTIVKNNISTFFIGRVFKVIVGKIAINLYIFEINIL